MFVLKRSHCSQVEWSAVNKFAFNEKLNPDDHMLGVQIVKVSHTSTENLFNDFLLVLRLNGTKPERIHFTKPERVNGTKPEHDNGTKPERVDGTKPERVNSTNGFSNLVSVVRTG